MNKSKNVPKIRFDGFSGKWENKKLGELGYTYIGLSGKTKKDFGHGKAKFITYMNVFSNSIINLKIVEPIEIDIKQNEVEVGDVFFTTSSEIPEEVGMSSVITEKQGILYLNSFCFGYRPIYKFNSYFLTYMLRSKNIRKKIILLAQGVSRYNISKKSVMKIEVFIPVINEQTLIGQYFSNIDNLIKLQQQKYEKLLNLKKSLLYKLFPKEGKTVPELRFEGFSGKWEKKKLLELGESTSGVSMESEFNKNGQLKVISIGSYSEKSKYIDQGIRSSINNKTSNRILNKNDLTMILNDKTASGNIIGRVLLIEENNVYIYNQRTERIEVYKEKFNPNFLYHMLNSNYIRSKIIKLAQGNTQIYVNWSTIKEIEYLIPKAYNEQKLIGQYFSKLDKLIELSKEKLEKLKNVKESLLDKMFV